MGVKWSRISDAKMLYMFTGLGKVLHGFMMATKKSLSYQQNVEVMHFMEEQVLKFAQEKGFEGIFTTNTSPLTQVCSL